MKNPPSRAPASFEQTRVHTGGRPPRSGSLKAPPDRPGRAPARAVDSARVSRCATDSRVRDREGSDRSRPRSRWATLQPRGAQRAYTAAAELHLVPPRPDAERAAALMGRLEQAGRQLAALPDARTAATTDGTIRNEARHVLREAWRLDVEHQEQLDVLSTAGLLAYAPVPDGSPNCCEPWTVPPAAPHCRPGSIPARGEQAVQMRAGLSSGPSSRARGAGIRERGGERVRQGPSPRARGAVRA